MVALVGSDSTRPLDVSSLPSPLRCRSGTLPLWYSAALVLCRSETGITERLTPISTATDEQSGHIFHHGRGNRINYVDSSAGGRPDLGTGRKRVRIFISHLGLP